MRLHLRFLAVLLFAALAVMPAKADQISQTLSFPLTTTDWSTTLVFNQFNSSLGKLTSIEFSVSGVVQGTSQVENLTNAAAIVTADLSASVTLTRPDSTVLVVTIPTAQTVDHLSAYDGTINFQPPSGATHANLVGNATNSATTSLASDLTLFTGTGTITLPFMATGDSSATGPGSIVTSFSTSASASATVIYNYTAVPEPSSLALLGCGGGVILACLHRRRNSARTKASA